MQFELPSRRDVKKCVVTKETIERGRQADARHRGGAGQPGRRAGRPSRRRPRLGWRGDDRSAPNTFAGATLDRAGHLRADPERIAALRADPRARAVAVVRDGALVEGDVGSCGADAWDRPHRRRAGRAAAAARDRAEQAPFLGLDRDGAPLFALDVLPGGAPPPGTELLNLRAAAAILPGDDAGLLGYAAGLLHWHRATRYCGKCGRPTEAGEGGPRAPLRAAATPIIRARTRSSIMLVTDGDRVLLGRQAVWPERRYSALAGFVEPGEALEAAVAREVREETGVAVSDVRYASSQPWPFPGSLMLGFEARYAGGDADPARRRARGRGLVHARGGRRRGTGGRRDAAAAAAAAGDRASARRRLDSLVSMPRVTRVRAIPWMIVLQAGVAAGSHWRNLNADERIRLKHLIVLSRGRPGNLSPGERDEVRDIAAKLDLTRPGPQARAGRRRRGRRRP